MDGYAFAELLRDCHNDVPILMLSAKQLPEDVKKGFLGVPGCAVIQPFLIAKITIALLANMVRTSKIKIKPVVYKLLSYPNKIFTRMQLMEDIWGPASDSTDATVCVHISSVI